VLTAVSPKSPAHETVKMRLHRWLAPLVVADAHEVRVEAPIIVPDRTSLPEPDVAVVATGGDPLRHPTTALLVIEVAVSSMRTDTQVKPALYAAAGVPELWVADVAACCLRVFREPGAGGYASEVTVERGAVVDATRVPAPPLKLAELFAGLQPAG
jgi:hypothetical protein